MAADYASIWHAISSCRSYKAAKARAGVAIKTSGGRQLSHQEEGYNCFLIREYDGRPCACARRQRAVVRMRVSRATGRRSLCRRLGGVVTSGRSGDSTAVSRVAIVSRETTGRLKTIAFPRRIRSIMAAILFCNQTITRVALMTR